MHWSLKGYDVLNEKVALLRSKEAVSQDFLAFFSLIQPVWVLDKQSKLVSLTKLFREDIHEKCDSGQCYTAWSQTIFFIFKNFYFHDF